ncbi:pectinesterase 2-like [Bidens hawaiensis]|uniref:pectinesterase 2-like n=1 Tax=Bidens hawaiensis TaxID=980011 RepID=UPI00404A346D
MCEKEFETANITNDKLAVISTNLTELLLNSLAISVVITGSNPPSLHGWNFINEHKLLNLAMNNKQPNVVVAKDGSGNFTTVQEAVNSAGQDRIWGQRYTIYVKAGVYEEQVVISKDVKFITMYGDGIGNTIITNNKHLGGDNNTTKVWDLKDSATFRCKIRAGDDLEPIIGEYKKAFLGRPWFSRAQTVFMQSFLDDLVDPTGWDDYRGYTETIYYVITDPNIAQQFTVGEFIAGNEWLPKSGVPFVPGLENQ